jgi:ABC-2 type transport system permease protein
VNTQSNAMPDARSNSQAIAPALADSTRPFFWSLRREFWEYRSLYLAPLAVGALMVFAFLITTIGRAMSIANLERRQAVLQEPYTFAAGAIMAAGFLVAIFFSFDTLYAERRDRSILFWKSLPVSDRTAVLAKALVPIVIMPLFTFAVTIIAEWLMMVMSTAALLGSGLTVATLWRQVSASQMGLLYHLVTVHMLWHAPIYAWFLLVSAWARRTPFLWAILPPIVIGFLEKIAFNTTYFVRWVGWRLSGPQDYGFETPPGHHLMHVMRQFELGNFLLTPGLWFGLAFTALFLAAAIRLRRDRQSA